MRPEEVRQDVKDILSKLYMRVMYDDRVYDTETSRLVLTTRPMVISGRDHTNCMGVKLYSTDTGRFFTVVVDMNVANKQQMLITMSPIPSNVAKGMYFEEKKRGAELHLSFDEAFKIEKPN